LSIRVRLLGTAAGGGLPQWNCACPNCREARLGRIAARTQSSVAISSGRKWFLINASADLRSQIEAFPDLQPDKNSLRSTPIAGVLLTNADLDHALGLFSLREGGRLNIYATRAVRTTLTRCLGLDTILNAFCCADWHEPPAVFTPLSSKKDAGDLSYRMIPLPGDPPPFAKKLSRRGTHSVAYQFMDRRTGGRLLVAPDVCAVTKGLLQALKKSDAVLFDGTFWSKDELKSIKSTAPAADEMGHVTIKDFSLDLLGKLPARHRIYIHLNNTNPVLAEDSPERAAVEGAGITVGQDGLEFEV
jgi:pyrroloquinoline quinone biosynthesis protein B